MNAAPVTPDTDTQSLLAGVTFSDAYRLEVEEPGMDAMLATRRAIASAPFWFDHLLNLRNLLVAPLGLKTVVEGDETGGRSIGPFPLVSQSPERVVLGFDDSHLDFRIVIDVHPLGGLRSEVIATTLVRTHNLLGRAYLAAVLPFHRFIVPIMLERAPLHAESARSG